jgi:hypothetical protein
MYEVEMLKMKTNVSKLFNADETEIICSATKSKVITTNVKI